MCVLTVQGFPPESFEYILLDAPCSALGLRPRLTHHVTLSELNQVSSLSHLSAYLDKLCDSRHISVRICTVAMGL